MLIRSVRSELLHLQHQNNVESLVMNVVSAVDMFAFWEGFKACRDILSGNVFQQIFESLDDEEDDYE